MSDTEPVGDAQTVLDFWFGAPGSAVFGSARREWFAKDEAFDALIRERFGAAIERALRGELEAWAEAAPSALAQILLLDQLTRNAFRGTARAFAGDARALAAASRMVGSRQDESLAPFMRCDRGARGVSSCASAAWRSSRLNRGRSRSRL